MYIFMVWVAWLGDFFIYNEIIFYFLLLIFVGYGLGGWIFWG